MQEYLTRAIENQFVEKLKPNKVTILFGARRVGKTMFLNEIIKNHIT
jgi:predicted AAA+ superfamily ATPase